jgi:hypothetical protein
MSNKVRAKGAESNRHAPVDIGALIDGAQLPRRTVDLCLRGDLQEEFEDLERQLQEENSRARTSLADGGRAREIAEAMEALREQMVASTVVFRLQALPRGEFRDLVAQHPPRDGNKIDHANGYNVDTFEPVMIRTCLLEPELTDEQWDRLVNKALTTNQWINLAAVAGALNFRRVEIPFSAAASMRLQSSDEG